MIILVIIECFFLYFYFLFRKIQLRNSGALDCDLFERRVDCACAAVMKAVMFILILALIIVGEKFISFGPAYYACTLINLIILSIILINGFIAYGFYSKAGFLDDNFYLAYACQKGNGGRAISWNELFGIYEKKDKIRFMVSPKGYYLFDGKDKERIYFNSMPQFVMSQLVFYVILNANDYDNRIIFV